MGRSSRPHIGIFGRRNNGKSSLINSIARQDIAIVSDHSGTTTDPVRKAMEIPEVGPVIIIDTAGIDDVGELGKKRVLKSITTIKIVDLAILVITENNFADYEKELISEFRKFKTPFFIIHNKSDLERLSTSLKDKLKKDYQIDLLEYSTLENTNLDELIEAIRRNTPESAYNKPSILGDLINYGDIVILVTPIDAEAPEGRLILPQVQTIRDILDNDCISVVLKERELDIYLRSINTPPKLVVTDSQEFLKVDAAVPEEIPLTSFSILFARLKGDFNEFIQGTPKISELKNDDKILVLESCSHHVSCDDIGRVKIPRWLTNYTGKKLQFDFVTGLDNLPEELENYALVVQCGGCVVTRKQILNRMKQVTDKHVPITNYGMLISYVHGIFNRAIAPFLDIDKESVDYL